MDDESGESMELMEEVPLKRTPDLFLAITSVRIVRFL